MFLGAGENLALAAPLRKYPRRENYVSSTTGAEALCVYGSLVHHVMGPCGCDVALSGARLAHQGSTL
jgi:hypothetical protein